MVTFFPEVHYHILSSTLSALPFQAFLCLCFFFFFFPAHSCDDGKAINCRGPAICNVIDEFRSETRRERHSHLPRRRLTSRVFFYAVEKYKYMMWLGGNNNTGDNLPIGGFCLSIAQKASVTLTFQSSCRLPQMNFMCLLAWLCVWAVWATFSGPANWAVGDALFFFFSLFGLSNAFKCNMETWL